MKFERKKKKDQIEEHCGMPFFDDGLEIVNQDLSEEEEVELWIYSLSCGDGWEITTNEDGTLTVIEK